MGSNRAELASVRRRKLLDLDVTIAEGVKLAKFEAGLGYFAVGVVTIGIILATVVYATVFPGSTISRAQLTISSLVMAIVGIFTIALIRLRSSTRLRDLTAQISERNKVVDNEFDAQTQD